MKLARCTNCFFPTATVISRCPGCDTIRTESEGVEECICVAAYGSIRALGSVQLALNSESAKLLGNEAVRTNPELAQLLVYNECPLESGEYWTALHTRRLVFCDIPVLALDCSRNSARDIEAVAIFGVALADHSVNRSGLVVIVCTHQMLELAPPAVRATTGSWSNDRTDIWESRKMLTWDWVGETFPSLAHALSDRVLLKWNVACTASGANLGKRSMTKNPSRGGGLVLEALLQASLVLKPQGRSIGRLTDLSSSLLGLALPGPERVSS